MNRKQLYCAKNYTYEARQKDIGWLHQIIESLHQQPEVGKDEDSQELFAHETIAVAKRLMKLITVEEPNKQDICELYRLLKIYKSVRNSAWDDIWTTFVNMWKSGIG